MEGADAHPLDLGELVEALRGAGFSVDTRQYLSAHELILAYASRGVALAEDLEALGSHLGPIFCTSPQEQLRFAALLQDVGAGSSREKKREPSPPPVRPSR